MTQDVVILAPGSRARLIMNQGGMGQDLVLCDVRNPMHDVNDDGSEGAMNLKPQYLIFHWFPLEAMMRDYFQDLVKEYVEEEREACRVAAQDEEDRARELQDRRGDYGGDMFRAGITQGRRQAASLIEARIRARSEGKGR